MTDELAPPIDLGLLTTFHEVARLGSVTAAARRLGRSQPAVSQRLRALEESLGVVLFEKIGRRLQLTARGKRLREESLDLLARARALSRRMADDGEDVEGPVVVGTLPTVASHLLVGVVEALLLEFPRLAPRVVLNYVPRLAELVRAGQIDIAVVIGQVDASGLDRRALGSTGLAAAFAPDRAPRPDGQVTPDELRGRRLLAWEGPPDPTFDRVRDYTLSHGLADAATARIPHIETLRELAGRGTGYTILPSYTLARDVAAGRLVALQPVGLDDRLPISSLTRRGQLRTPALTQLEAALATHVGSS